MKEAWNKIYTNNYNNLEWAFIKIVLILLWVKLASIVFNSFQTAPLPQGICKIFPCEFFLDGFGKYLLIFTLVIVTVLYVLEIKQVFSCLIIFIISTLLFTIEESNGILNRSSLFTFVFFAQFLAYLLHSYDPTTNIKKDRIQFSVQVIAAGYTLSALSKLYQSGFMWIQDGQRITLQILKSFQTLYVTDGDVKNLETAQEMVSFIENHETLVFILLGSSLILELFALIAVKSKKHALVYGILLTFMHIGIFIVMDIAIVSIVIPMILFMVNPFYIIWLFVKGLYKKIVSYSPYLFRYNTN